MKLITLLSAIMMSTLSCSSSFAFVKPAGTPDVKYINPAGQKVSTPKVIGKYYEATVPDTLDLAERARLFVEHTAKLPIPELDYEPYNKGDFGVKPPRLQLDSGSYTCGWAKYQENLPLQRIMSGSMVRLDIDKAWACHIPKCIGTDGMFYVPRIGRPWDGIGGHYVSVDGHDHYSVIATNLGRLLGTLSIYYKMTGDAQWKKIGCGLVDSLDRRAVKIDGAALFPRPYLFPEEQFTQQEIDSAVKNFRLGESVAFDASHLQKTGGEDASNLALWQTWVITGLAQFNQVTKYAPAKDLAYGMMNYQRKVGYLEKWESHFHCMSLGIHAALELALATDDRELAEYGEKYYEFAKSGGKVNAVPSLGFFAWDPRFGPSAIMETCSAGDMLAIAVKLTQLKMGDKYWEDVDRYVRNCVSSLQIMSADQVNAHFASLAANAPEKPLAYNEIADGLENILVGSFSCGSTPNEMFNGSYRDSCCQNNAARSLYYAWESILDFDKGDLNVNLLLNRASVWADIESYIPYTGRVDVKIKKPLKTLRVRMNYWIDKNTVKCTVDGKENAFTWDGNRACMTNLRLGSVVNLNFAIEERTEKFTAYNTNFTAIFRGNDCVDMSPKGSVYPLFNRPQYRNSQPGFIKVRRFIYSDVVRY